jgi:hypothetical protein
LRQLVLAFLGAFLALCAIAFPRVASAAPAESCDRDAFASMMPLAELAAMLRANALAETDLVGFCDSRGATAIAPLPARPLDSSVLDAAEGQASWSHDGTNVDGRRDAPSQHPSDAGAVDLGIPSVVLGLPMRGLPITLFHNIERRELPDGFGRGVDHPPRLS